MANSPTLDLNLIRDYLLQMGGKIEYPILVNAFKKHLYNPDPSIQGQIRIQFKDCVNRLATVSLENNMKFINLRPEFMPPPSAAALAPVAQKQHPPTPHVADPSPNPLPPPPPPPPPPPQPQLQQQQQQQQPIIAPQPPVANSLPPRSPLNRQQHLGPFPGPAEPPKQQQPIVQHPPKMANSQPFQRPLLAAAQPTQPPPPPHGYFQQPLQKSQIPPPEHGQLPQPLQSSPFPTAQLQSSQVLHPQTLVSSHLLPHQQAPLSRHPPMVVQQSPPPLPPHKQPKQQQPLQQQPPQQQYQQRTPLLPPQARPHQGLQQQPELPPRLPAHQTLAATTPIENNDAAGDPNQAFDVHDSARLPVTPTTTMPTTTTPLLPSAIRRGQTMPRPESLNLGTSSQMPPPRPPPRRRQSTASLLNKPSLDSPARTAAEKSQEIEELVKKSPGRVREHASKLNSSASSSDLSALLPKRSNTMKENRPFTNGGPPRRNGSHSTTRSRSSYREDESDSSSLQPIDPLRRKWVIESCNCNYNGLLTLIREDPNLISCKDVANGYTALHWAAKFGNLDIIKLIAGTAGLSPDIKSSSGHTPLHVAYLFDKIDAADLLLKIYKANPNARDHSGKRPMQYWVNKSAVTITATTRN